MHPVQDRGPGGPVVRVTPVGNVRPIRRTAPQPVRLMRPKNATAAIRARFIRRERTPLPPRVATPRRGYQRAMQSRRVETTSPQFRLAVLTWDEETGNG